ncbi:MAG: co-chaperone GroES [Cytophagales bacterium]|nr:co-chaperone GroES [Cytophagales bacterium]
MHITADNKLKKLVIVGDRVLIRPKTHSDKTESGLFLPPRGEGKGKIQYGYVIKVGPGYPIPLPGEADEPWREADDQVKYIPLQAKEGDLAVFIQSGSFEIIYQGEKYFIVPQSNLLMLEREEDLG